MILSNATLGIVHLFNLIVHLVIQKCSLNAHSGSVILYNRITRMCYWGLYAEAVWDVTQSFPLEELYGSAGGAAVEWHMPPD